MMVDAPSMANSLFADEPTMINYNIFDMPSDEVEKGFMDLLAIPDNYDIAPPAAAGAPSFLIHDLLHHHYQPPPQHLPGAAGTPSPSSQQQQQQQQREQQK